MKYRPHKGLLADSMAEMVEIEPTRRALINRIREELSPWLSFNDDAIHINPYCNGDPRIGWDQVWIVTLDGYGVLGFCDGPAG